jgi:hypothetical protein
MSHAMTTTDALIADLPLSIPPLEQGDFLTRAEFERRYEAMPNVKKAELIEGEVHMPSPVRFQKHAAPHARFVFWLMHYHLATPGVVVADGGTVRLDMANEYQPDGFMFIHPNNGGKARISADDYVEGSPELVGEISGSSVSIDLNSKFKVYHRNGVQEYIVWRVLDKALDWFALHEGNFKPLPIDASGWLRSQVFPGLWLDADALVRDDMATVLNVLQRGLESPEHAGFVKHLQKPPQAAG